MPICPIVLVIALSCGAPPPDAQVMRLPAIDVTEILPSPPVIVEGPAYADLPVPPFEMPVTVESQPLPPPVLAPSADPDVPRDARAGFFQKVYFESTWLARMGAGGLGMTDTEASAMFALPCPTRQWPLLITPGFATHFLDGPQSGDLPPRLYDAYTQFRWVPRLGSRLKADVAVTPGVYSDFETRQGAMRVTGRGAAIWDWSPALRFLLGVAYLDRRDINLLPIAGVVWKPSEDVRWELVFPRPRIARRLYWGNAGRPNVEDWGYVGGELGDGVWAFEHSDGQSDVVSYRDYRVLVGMERKVYYGLTSKLEVGYVFGRRLEFQEGRPDIDPTDTVMVRGSLAY